MKRVDGIWLPDSDRHFARMMCKEKPRNYHGELVGCYQAFKIEKALSLTSGRGVALDVGAHVGFWSMWLAEEFQEVHAFEPMPEHVECFVRNVKGHNVVMHPHAVGAGHSWSGIAPHPDNSGKTCMTAGDAVEVHAIDRYLFRDVDLIKIDVEGFEPEVLKGAADTIDRCSPLVIFEDNGQHERYGFEIPSRIAERMGLKEVARLGKDLFYARC